MPGDRDAKNITHDCDCILPKPGSEVFQSDIFQNLGMLGSGFRLDRKGPRRFISKLQYLSRRIRGLFKTSGLSVSHGFLQYTIYLSCLRNM